MAFRKVQRKRYSTRRPMRPKVSKQLQVNRKNAGIKPVSNMEWLASKATQAGQIAGAVANLAKLINSEAHYVDFSGAGTWDSTSYNNYRLSLSDITQNDTPNGRTGNKLLYKNLQFNIIFNPRSEGLCAGTFVIVLDKTAENATPTWNSIYGGAGNPIGTRLKDDDRFRILKKVHFTGSGLVRQPRIVKFNIPLSGIHQMFSGSGGTTQTSNRIWIFATTDGLPMDYNFTTRLNFHDN